MRPEAAREIARRWLADVAQGKDPSEARKKDRTALTVRDLCTRYMSEHAETRKKDSSIRNDRRLIDAHIIPALGSKKVASVTRADIAGLHHALRATPYEANRMLAMASKMFGLAERWGLRPDHSNPAKNIDRYREHKRERYLTNAEVARLWQVLNSDAATAKASPAAISAIKLLMLTGRRLNEVLGLKWAWVDLDAKVLRLPDTKNGALLVSLGDAAVSVLGELKASGRDDNYVIAGQRKGAPLVNLQKPWRALRALAGLHDVRIHDLRHTFASIGAGMGMSLHMLGRLLGHTQAATTSRYAHLAQDPVRTAADAIGAELMRLVVASDQAPI
nr:site-specific integrase [Sphingomonas sp. JXJ CY 53]